jgi:tyrosine-protein kinase Etk/Wzc
MQPIADNLNDRSSNLCSAFKGLPLLVLRSAVRARAKTGFMSPGALPEANRMQLVNSKVLTMKAIDRIETASDFDPRSDDFSFSDLWRNLRDHLKIFCLTVAGCVILAAVYGMLATPVYKVNMLIQVQKQQASLLGALADVTGGLNATSAVEGELDVIKSRTIVGAAIAAVHADTQVSVNNYFPLLGRVYAERHRIPSGSLAAPVPGLSSYAWGGERLGLSRFLIPQTDYDTPFYLTIEPDNRWTLKGSGDDVLATGKVGELARFRVGTATDGKEAEVLVSNYLGRPGTVFRIVQQSPADAYEAIDKKVTAEETSKDSSMIRLTVAGDNPLMTAALADAIGRQYVALNVRERSQQARMSLQFLQEKLPSIKRALDESEETLNQFRMDSNTIDVRQQTEALLSRAVDLKRQRTAVELNLEANTKNFTSAYPGQEALQNQLNVLNTELSSLDQEVSALPAKQQRYFRLARDVTVNTQLYTALLANAQQLEVAQAGTTGNVFVVDGASIPTKMSWPSLSILLSGSLFGGVLFAFIVVQFLGSRRNVMRDTTQIEHFSQVPLYFTVPISKAQELLMRSSESERRMLSEVKADDPSIEALRSLRSNLQLPANKERNVVLFTGPIQGVGKSFIATNFAYLLALNGHRVILIDADLRRSSLHHYLPPYRTKGLAEVLEGTVSLESAVRQGVPENFHYLPAAQNLPRNPAELLDLPAFGVLIERLKTQYDYVIIDSPPVLPLSDSLAIATHCDQVFLVSRSNMSTARQLRETIERLETAGVQVTGHIFNGALRYDYAYGYAESKYGPSA